MYVLNEQNYFVLLPLFRDTREPDDIIPKYWGQDVHREDILCMTYQEPNILVTSSYDGDIILWDMETQHVISVLNATDVDYSRQQYRLYSKLCSKTRKKMENENSKNKRKGKLKENRYT